MISLYNAISLLRFPLGLCFFIDQPLVRFTIVFLAMASDILDGYLARKHQATSATGAWLDPLMDKWFTGIATLILYSEGRLDLISLALLFSRDFVILCCGLWVIASGKLKSQKFGSLITGKIATSYQIILLALLSLGITVPPYAYLFFAALIPFVLFEIISGVVKHSKQPS